MFQFRKMGNAIVMFIVGNGRKNFHIVRYNRLHFCHLVNDFAANSLFELPVCEVLFSQQDFSVFFSLFSTSIG